MLKYLIVFVAGLLLGALIPHKRPPAIIQKQDCMAWWFQGDHSRAMRAVDSACKAKAHKRTRVFAAYNKKDAE